MNKYLKKLLLLGVACSLLTFIACNKKPTVNPYFGNTIQLNKEYIDINYKNYKAQSHNKHVRNEIKTERARQKLQAEIDRLCGKPIPCEIDEGLPLRQISPLQFTEKSNIHTGMAYEGSFIVTEDIPFSTAAEHTKSGLVYTQYIYTFVMYDIDRISTDKPNAYFKSMIGVDPGYCYYRTKYLNEKHNNHNSYGELTTLERIYTKNTDVDSLKYFSFWNKGDTIQITGDIYFYEELTRFTGIKLSLAY